MNYKNIKEDLNRLSMKYQKGGIIDERGKQIFDKAAKQNFNSAIQSEKEYLLGNKVRERLINLGLDPDTEIPKLWDKLKTVTVGVDDSSGNTNGAYYSDFGNAIKYSYERASNVDSDTMSHEVGHIFNRPNIRNSDMLDSRNAFVDQSTMGGIWQKIKKGLSSDYRDGEGHEASWEETVADVHAARQELNNMGNYDGRFSNFTNEAYNQMRRYAEKDPTSASGRLFFKVGAPETARYKMLKLKYQQISPYDIPQEDKDFLKDYEKNKKKYEDVQKRNIFDAMNKVVSNDSVNSTVDFAKLGGLIKILNNGKV